MSCTSGLICWPIVAGQLGQKIVGVRNLCLCFALPMLIYAIANTFVNMQRLRNVVSGGELRLSNSHSYGGIAETFLQFSEYTSLALNVTFDHADESAEFETSLAGLEALLKGWLGVQMQMDARDVVCWLSGVGLGAMVVWKTMLRVLVRQRDAIPGSPLRDLCISTSCCCLSLCQLARHEGLVGSRYGIVSPTGEKPHTQVAVMAV